MVSTQAIVFPIVLVALGALITIIFRPWQRDPFVEDPLHDEATVLEDVINPEDPSTSDLEQPPLPSILETSELEAQTVS